MALRTLSIEPGVRLSIRLTGHLTCRCPFGSRRDYATVDVAYRTSDRTIELASFAAFLDQYADLTVSHEAVTSELYAILLETLGDDALMVTTTWAPVEGIACVVRAGGGSSCT